MVASLVLRARAAAPAIDYASLRMQHPSETDREMIDKDVHRAGREALGVADEDAKSHREALRRVLHAWCVLRPEVGYCQAMNAVAAALLVVCDHAEVPRCRRDAARVVVDIFY